MGEYRGLSTKSNFRCLEKCFFYIEIISFLKLRLISFNILFVSLLRLFFRFFFLFKRELVKLCVSRNYKCVVLFTFDLICLLILGGEHIEGIDQGRGKSGARVQIAPSILRLCTNWHTNTNLSFLVYQKKTFYAPSILSPYPAPVDLFSTTTFGKFPMKNSFTHREL